MVMTKIRFHVRGLCWRWFWLAIIMSGNSQQDKTSKGDEIWSMLAHRVRFL